MKDEYSIPLHAQMPYVTMRRFVLVRSEDVSGVSGVGTVAEGVEFSNGRCVLSWLSDLSSIAIYESAEELVAIHGHEGRTALKFLDPESIP